MTTLGRLTDEEQFGDMILKSDDQGRIVRLRDVARTELGALAYDQVCTLDGTAVGGPLDLSTARLERAGNGASRCARRWKS